MSIQLDDPTTWPDDDATLLKMANAGGVAEAVEPSETTDTVRPTEPEAKPVGTTEAAEPEAKPTEPVAAETPKLRPLTAEPSEGATVQAADGHSVIPYSVLQEARSAARKAEEEAARLQAELAAAKAQSQQPVPEQPAQTALPEAVQQQLTRIRENWGDDIAQQAERTWRLERQVIEQQQVIEQLATYTKQQQAARQRSEEDQIADAIAASPKLDAWSRAADPGWYDRAVALHDTLMKGDRTYAAASWMERFKQLPDRVEAVFGPSFETVSTKDVPAKVTAAMDQPPRSLSEVNGGSTPEPTETQKLDKLTGNELTAYMDKLARDPKRFETFLRSIAL